MDRPNLASPILPVAAALAGVGCLAVMDAFMKEAALTTGAYTATVLRAIIGAAIIAPAYLWQRKGWPNRSTMKLHLERGIISAFMALSFFFALTKLPLAEAIALSFIAPLIALYLARLLLGEVIKPQAIFASILGFAGTLVIVSGKIGTGTFDQDTGLGLGAMAFSALLYAYNFIVIRKQSQVAGPVEVATFHSGVGGLVLLTLAPFLAMNHPRWCLWHSQARSLCWGQWRWLGPMHAPRRRRSYQSNTPVFSGQACWGGCSFKKQ